jgi:hypothetical protein
MQDSMPMPAPSAPEPQVSEMPAVPQSNPNVGHKKKLLNKLMENLLNKPGRSMHETINGVKSAIGAFKNYSKEWDTLNGINPDQGSAQGGTEMPSSVSSAPGSDKIKQIMQDIQAKKAQQPTDGGGGPGFSAMAPAPTLSVPPAVNAGAGGSGNVIQPMPPLIAGQPQTSSFNRPAPTSSLGIFGY